jgi:hypothetical protein
VSLDTCMSCGVQGPTVFVSLSQTKGALFVRYETHLDSRLCAACLKYNFWRFTQTNLLFGWWSPFSAFLTPIYTVQNGWAYLRARSAFRRAIVDHPTEVRPE